MTESYLQLGQSIKDLPPPPDAQFACAMPDAKPPRDRCVKQCPHCFSVAVANRLGYPLINLASLDLEHAGSGGAGIPDASSEAHSSHA